MSTKLIGVHRKPAKIIQTLSWDHEGSPFSRFLPRFWTAMKQKKIHTPNAASQVINAADDK